MRAVAYNDAGSSPYVYDDDTTLPAPFSIKASDYVARRLVAVYNVPASYYDSGGKTEFSYKISLAGDESFGATSYSATGSITSPSIDNSTGTLNTSSLPSNSSFSTSGSTYNGVPGAVTTIKVTSKTNFNETRLAKATFLAYPDSVKRADYFQARSTTETALVNWYYLRTLYGYATSAQVYAAWLDGQYSNGCTTASVLASEGEKTWNTGSSATVFGLTYSQIALSKAEGRCMTDWDVTYVTDNGQTQSGVKYTSYGVGIDNNLTVSSSKTVYVPQYFYGDNSDSACAISVTNAGEAYSRTGIGVCGIVYAENRLFTSSDYGYGLRSIGGVSLTGATIRR